MAANIRRLFQLWKLSAYLDLMWITRDRIHFITYVLSDSIQNLAWVTGTLFLVERFNGIGPWSKFQVLFFLGYGILVQWMLSAFFNYNVLHISRRIGRGQFDHVLIQPQPLWMILLTEGFLPFSESATLLPGVVLVVWAVQNLNLAVTPLWICMLALNLIASTAIILAFSFTWGSLAFRFPRATEEISSSAVDIMTEVRLFPLDGLAPALIGGLLTVLPAGFVAWMPSRALLGVDVSPVALWFTPLAAIVFAFVTIFLFRKGLQYYVQTGSQRYLSHGHRR